jgi:hypothetical protein
MSRTNGKFILVYTLLVGLPLIGLVGVLKSGRSLTAPVSVDGLWQVEVDSARWAAIPCGKNLGQYPDLAVAISQSGRNFTLNLSNDPKSTGAGVLAGTSLKASLIPSATWSAEPDCGSGRAFSLEAVVDKKADPPSLTGRFSVKNCPSCGAVEFRAIRKVPPAKELH